MTILYIILWIIGLVVVPLVVAEIAVYIKQSTFRDPGDGYILVVGVSIITFVLYLIVSAVWFFV